MIIGLLNLEKNLRLIKAKYGTSLLLKVRRTGRPDHQYSGTLVYVRNKKLLTNALSSKYVAAIILPEDFGLSFSELKELGREKAIIVASDPEELFYNIHNALFEQVETLESVANDIAVDANIHPTAVIGNGVTINSGVTIGAYTVIGDRVYIGKGTFIGSHVSIGDDGLFWYDDGPKKKHVNHYGAVMIGDNCHIQSHTVIARSCFANAFTSIATDVFLGFHVTIGHDCAVGRGCSISSQAAIAGHTRLGEDCWVGLGALVSNTLTVGDKASIKAGAVVIKSVAAGSSVSGNFAITHHTNLKEFLKKGR